jgi:hypothetical protein
MKSTICTSVQGWLALKFESHSTHKMDFANLNQSLTKRVLVSVLKAQKYGRELAESTSSKGGGQGVFIDPLKN